MHGRFLDLWTNGGSDMTTGIALTDEAIAAMTDEQRSIISELGQYAAQELNLTEVISSISEHVKGARTEAGFTHTDSPGRLHEDPEVDILISAKARHKIGNVEGQIRRTLERALQVGLGEYRIIRQQCENYGVALKG